MSNGVVMADTINALRHWLDASAFKPGARLPSERQLVGQLGITHNAINRAMGRLIAEGVVQREGYRLFYRGVDQARPDVWTCDLILARRSILLRSYRKVAKELGVGLNLHYYESIEEALAHLHGLAQGTGCNGVLFDPSHVDPADLWAPALLRLRSQETSVVGIRQSCAGIPCVLADYSQAIDLACQCLADAGHSELALLTILPRAPVAIEIHEIWQALGREDGRRETAGRIAYYSGAREEARHIAAKLAGEWKAVTALVVYAEHAPIVPQLLAELGKLKIQVPADLSLICLGDLPHLSTSTPPVSAVAFEAAMMQEMAFRLLQRQERKKGEIGFRSSVSSIRIQPHYMQRGSIALRGRALAGKVRDTNSGGSKGMDARMPAVDSPSEVRRTLRAMWKRPYSLTSIAPASSFKSVDLTPFVNRPLNFRKGWLGDLPLKHLGAGLHKINGVPFRVLGGRSRKDHGAVVFRSMTNETGNGQVLPSSVVIPIGRQAVSIYILHGCGYVRYLNRFATYEFYAGKKRLDTIPLVTLGRPPPGFDPDQFERDSARANIQDWWPDYTHIDYMHARRVPIVEAEDEAAVYRHVYLYTLEWQNPFPDLTVSHMKITADPNQSTTLGMLAVSVLQKKAD
jgi:DNA-binding LacI/PurR family transcriptional regulator